MSTSNGSVSLHAATLHELMVNVIGAAFDVSSRAVDLPIAPAVRTWPTARIGLHGDFNLNVWVAVKPELGTYLVARALDCDERQVTGEMVKDTIKELANMIAGQVKATLGADCHIGLPELSPPWEEPIVSCTQLAARKRDEVDLCVAVGVERP